MEELRATVFREGAAKRGMPDDQVVQGRSQRRGVELACEMDDVGFVERTVRVIAHLNGMENLALRLGGRRAVEAWKRDGSGSRDSGR